MIGFWELLLIAVVFSILILPSLFKKNRGFSSTVRLYLGIAALVLVILLLGRLVFLLIGKVIALTLTLLIVVLLILHRTFKRNA